LAVIPAFAGMTAKMVISLAIDDRYSGADR
jgi:hypothetical protein